MVNMTERCVNFITSFHLSSVSDLAVERAKDTFIDTLGVLIAAKNEPVVTKMLNFLEQSKLLQHQDGQSTIIPFSLKTNPRDAAWMMGTMAHALDYDDTSPVMNGHPSAVLISAILSLAEAYNRSGKCVLEGYICGLEVMHKLANGKASIQYDQGWHTTSTIGVIGAAAATSKVLGLNEKQTCYALGIAASSASGLRANFGTMTKPLHAGHAASMGVLAGMLAEKEVTASTTILEDVFGYGDVFYNNLVFEDASFFLDDLYLNSYGLNVKVYPSCSMTHRPLDAVFSLVKEHEIMPDQIEEMECLISKRAASILSYHNPIDGMEAKFSLEYCIASAIYDQEVSLRQFHDDQVKRVHIKDMMKRVKIKVVENMNPEKATVNIEMKRGKTYTSTVTDPIGSRKNPLTREQLKQRFSNCVERIMNEEQQHTVLSYLEKLEDIESVRSVLDSFVSELQKN